MKKTVFAFLAVAMLAALTSCNFAKIVSPNNVIRSADLSAEQKEIVELLSMPNQQEIMIFDFDTNEAYGQLELWVEFYENGEAVGRIANMEGHFDNAEMLNGRVVVMINQDQWTLSIIHNGSRADYTGTGEMAVDSGFARAFGQMDGPAHIEDGKEIVLYSSLFTAKNTLPAYSTQTLQEQPELLKEFRFAYLVKCKFSK